MSSFEEKVSSFATSLFKCGAVKFGDFKMKSGTNSPIYFDLRVIVSYPELLETVVDLLLELSKGAINCDLLCGVPYTALPIATILSVKTKIPMLIRRKEAKAYGTKKLIEGKYNKNDDCIIVEDVITTGSSVLETVSDLKKESISVTKAIVILDRGQGGLENLMSNGIQVTSLLTMAKLVDILQKTNMISSAQVIKVEEYLKSSRVELPEKLINDVDKSTLSFEERSKLAKNPIGKKLFEVMALKQTNVCLAADVTTCNQVLDLLRLTGPYICILKLHIDILQDFNQDFICELKSLADQYNVLLMEDRKYGDIGNTVSMQFRQGIYQVEKWAHMVTAHAMPGPGVLQGISAANKSTGVFLVVEMSSEGSLTPPQYVEGATKIINDYLDVVAGVVCQTKGICKSPGLVQLTPGVQLNDSCDNLGQKYNTPEDVIVNNDADVAVVGRGIIKAKDPAKAAKLYRDTLWECYKTRIAQM